MTTALNEADIAITVMDFNGVVVTLAYDMKVRDAQVFSGTSEHVFLNREGRFVRMKKVMPEFCAALEQQIEKHRLYG